jgi:hypothetical protein
MLFPSLLFYALADDAIDKELAKRARCSEAESRADVRYNVIEFLKRNVRKQNAATVRKIDDRAMGIMVGGGDYRCG